MELDVTKIDNEHLQIKPKCSQLKSGIYRLIIKQATFIHTQKVVVNTK